MIPTPLEVVRGAVRGTTFFAEQSHAVTPVRLPAWTIPQHADGGMARMSNQTAGVFLEFDTAATVIELEVMLTRTIPSTLSEADRPATFSCLIAGAEIDRAVLTEGELVRVSADGSTTSTPGSPSRVILKPGGGADVTRRVELWLPHTAAVEIRAVRSDTPLLPAEARPGPRWLHYGSSISHCAAADSPTGTWPTVAARALDWRLTNLGFGGQAMLDSFVARTIRELPADLITLKIGINPVNGDTLRARTFGPAVHGFLDTIREGHPDTPIVVISPIACPIHETTPGPTVPDGDGFQGTPDAGDRPGVLTLERVRATLESLVSVRSDDNLSYLDGRSLLAAAESHLLYDRLHPNAEGYQLIGERFAALAKGAHWVSFADR